MKMINQYSATLTVWPSRGFTLIELMIAMTLGLLLMTAVVSVFVGSLGTYRTADSLSRIQESARITLEVMRQDFRQAGFFGCRNSLQMEADPLAEGSLPPGRIRNTLNGGNWQFDFGAAIEGYTHGGSAWSNTIAGVAFNPTSAGLAPAPAVHSDIVAVSMATDAGIVVTSHPGGNPPGSAALQISKPNQVEKFDVLLVSDCNTGAIFQATNVSGGNSPETTLRHQTGNGTPGNRTTALGQRFTDANVFTMTKHFYYVANSPDTGRPGLFRDGQELAEDVERMRAYFGVNTDGVPGVDNYLTADAVADWGDVLSVRFELIFSSGDETDVVDAPQTFPLFDGTTYTAPDTRLHQLFTLTVGLRNRLP